jgi:carbamoyl-phosphate synthase small subunit
VPALLMPIQKKALLALADGTIFHGISIGVAGHSTGEVVFNTSLTGYQEILTDPSYRRQIVTLTYPHIGSYGVNAQDAESAQVQAAGLVIKDLALQASNFRHTLTLSAYLHACGTVAIAGIDTRRLTRLLREQGSQNGCILGLPEGQETTPEHIEQAVAQARAAPAMAGLDLAQEVSCREPFEWTQTEWNLKSGYGQSSLSSAALHVVVYDFGVKHNILRMLAHRGCRVTVVPAKTPVADVLALAPQGVFFSNGPGDPQPCTYAIAAARHIIEQGLPAFGLWC